MGKRLQKIRERLGIPSGRAILHLVLVEIIINALWNWISRMFSIALVREIGFLVLIVAGLFAVAWYLPKLSPMLSGASKVTNKKEQNETKWLERIADHDRDTPEAEVFVHHIAILWRLMDRSGAYFFDFQVHVFNGSVYDLVLGTRVEGNIKYDADTLMPHPEVNEMPKSLIQHGEQAYVQLQQDITRLEPIIAKLRNKVGEPVTLYFGDLKIWAEYQEPGGKQVASFPLKLIPKVQSPKIQFTV